MQRLLASRPDIFPDYTEEGFERAFEGCFEIRDRQSIPDPDRVLYLMRARSGD